jgi:hypothetical protein
MGKCETGICDLRGCNASFLRYAVGHSLEQMPVWKGTHRRFLWAIPVKCVESNLPMRRFLAQEGA